MKYVVMIIVLALIACCASAQGDSHCQKIGFADASVIIKSMPEIRTIEAELKSVGGQYQNQLRLKYDAYSREVDEYEKAVAPEAKNIRQKQLMRTKEAIDLFEKESAVAFQQRQD